MASIRSSRKTEQRPAGIPAAPGGHRYLALHFPELPLDALGRSGSDEPWAIRAGSRVGVVNRPAARAGVSAGMAVAAALGLCPGLHLPSPCPQAEQALLERLAARLWSRYSSRLYRERDGIILEIAGSRRLFGGESALRRQLDQELAELGPRVCSGSADTPLAAWWLACSGGVEELGGVPLTVVCTRAEAHALATLGDLGVHTLAGLEALPRAGLGRRFGAGLLRRVDLARGRVAETRRPWQPPERFSTTLALPAPAAEQGALLFAGRRLVDQLVEHLRAVGRAVTGFTLWLQGEDGPAEPLRIGLARPGRNPDHLHALLRNALESFRLRAPVARLRLEAGALLEAVPVAGDLFAGEGVADAGAALLDRLRARLGEEAITGITLVDDHRPERAWRRVPAGEKVTTPSVAGLPERPHWLLAEPVAVPPPAMAGPVERIVAGWWDDGPVDRAYCWHWADGQWQWLFRDRRGWFMHGLLD